MKTRYRVEDAVLPLKVMAKAKRAGVLPIALLGIAGYVLWSQRDRLNELLQPLAAKAQGNDETGEAFESVPADYDWNRPSIANSTAMAGPVNGAGEPRGLDGGSMGTDLGTQGEGAL